MINTELEKLIPKEDACSLEEQKQKKKKGVLCSSAGCSDALHSLTHFFRVKKNLRNWKWFGFKSTAGDCEDEAVNCLVKGFGVHVENQVEKVGLSSGRAGGEATGSDTSSPHRRPSTSNGRAHSCSCFSDRRDLRWVGEWLSLMKRCTTLGGLLLWR